MNFENYDQNELKSLLEKYRGKHITFNAFVAQIKIFAGALSIDYIDSLLLEEEKKQIEVNTKEDSQRPVESMRLVAPEVELRQKDIFYRSGVLALRKKYIK